MSHPSNRITHDDVETVCAYHAPTQDDIARYAEIRKAAIDFMHVILTVVPECADRSTALRCVREARMWANSAIALNGK